MGTNAIDTRTNGVDVTANYRMALHSAGDVRLRAGYELTVVLRSGNDGEVHTESVAPPVAAEPHAVAYT